MSERVTITVSLEASNGKTGDDLWGTKLSAEYYNCDKAGLPLFEGELAEALKRVSAAANGPAPVALKRA